MALINIPGFQTGLISPRLLGNTSFEGYTTALSDARNRLIGIYGQIGVRPGFQYIAEVKDSSVKSYLIPFKYSNTDTYILEFTNTKIRFYEDRAQIVSGTPYEVTTPYTTSEIPDLRYVQKFDKIFIVHPNHAPRELARISDTNWTLTEMDFDEPAWLDTNLTDTTLTFSATTGTGVTCTSSASLFASTDVGRSIRFKAGPDDTDSVTYLNIGASQKHFNIPFYPQTNSSVEVFVKDSTGAITEQTYNAGTLSSGEFKITDGQVELFAAPSSGEEVVVQRKNTGSGEWGWATITAYSSATSVTVTINSELGGTNASNEWRLGAWSETTGYPSLITFYQGRLWFANTTSNPDVIWNSEIENFYNFSPDNVFNKGQIDDSTGGSATLSEINTIQFMEGLNILMLGGEGLKSIGKGGAAVSNPILVLPEDGTICSNVKPVKNKNEIIFTDAQKKTIYSAQFDFQSNSYKPNTLNILTDDLFETSPVAEMTLLDLPFPMLFVRTEDGNLFSCTYKPELGRQAWMKHQIGGTDAEVESIAQIPNNNKSELWVVVKRTVNSATFRSIECMHNFFYLDAKTTATFSDSYLTYSGSATTTLTGLTHLVGETVEVIGNGGYVGEFVVDGSGEIDIFPIEVTTATVGLKYDKYFETVVSDLGKFNGMAKGHYAVGKMAIVQMFETDGLAASFVGDSTTVDVNFRGTELTGDSVNPLFTGFKEVYLSANIGRGVKVRIDQPYPLPQTILSLTYSIDVDQKG